ncbi:hypothetical protein R3P38DRAFT_3177477 [Favolaschia claudopus]|uniref:Uncharacterized protein n=1 Tax=Favolaschia claudopus TaxID=2862362 RepID=A0AAW0D1X6_9AGAR
MSLPAPAASVRAAIPRTHPKNSSRLHHPLKSDDYDDLPCCKLSRDELATSLFFLPLSRPLRRRQRIVLPRAITGVFVTHPPFAQALFLNLFLRWVALGLIPTLGVLCVRFGRPCSPRGAPETKCRSRPQPRRSGRPFPAHTPKTHLAFIILSNPTITTIYLAKRWGNSAACYGTYLGKDARCGTSHRKTYSFELSTPTPLSSPLDV